MLLDEVSFNILNRTVHLLLVNQQLFSKCRKKGFITHVELLLQVLDIRFCFCGHSFGWNMDLIWKLPHHMHLLFNLFYDVPSSVRQFIISGLWKELIRKFLQSDRIVIYFLRFYGQWLSHFLQILALIWLQSSKRREFLQNQLSDQVFKKDAIDGHRVDPREVKEFSDRFYILSVHDVSNWNSSLWHTLMYALHLSDRADDISIGSSASIDRWFSIDTFCIASGDIGWCGRGVDILPKTFHFCFKF